MSRGERSRRSSLPRGPGHVGILRSANSKARSIDERVINRAGVVAQDGRDRVVANGLDREVDIVIGKRTRSASRW